MTKVEAFREAHQRWATPGTSVTDRVAVVTLRRYGVRDRCEVGWYVRGGGGTIVVGRGPTWEEAFADADARDKEESK